MEAIIRRQRERERGRREGGRRERGRRERGRGRRQRGKEGGKEEKIIRLVIVKIKWKYWIVCTEHVQLKKNKRGRVQ